MDRQSSRRWKWRLAGHSVGTWGVCAMRRMRRMRRAHMSWCHDTMHRISHGTFGARCATFLRLNLYSYLSSTLRNCRILSKLWHKLFQKRLECPIVQAFPKEIGEWYSAQVQHSAFPLKTRQNHLEIYWKLMKTEENYVSQKMYFIDTFWHLLTQ